MRYLKRLDFTRELLYVCRFIVDDLIARIKAKVDINGAPVPPNKPATVKKKGFDHRMINTGNFIKHAFRYDAKETVASIYINPARHPKSRATYWEVGAYNLKGHPLQNPRANAAVWFGLNEQVEEKATDYLTRAILKELDRKIIFKEIIDAVI